VSFYQRYLLPYLTHVAMRQKQLLPFRTRAAGAARGLEPDPITLKRIRRA